MDVLGSTDQVQLNLFRTQLDEERQVRALASGLRVISASDDPSGLAISQTIQSQVLGRQQGIQNVQTANNLLDVADGALANVQDVLQKIHGLIVEASSDLNSIGDLQQIQTQIDSLLDEINKIAGGANFNGVSLLNGSLAGFTSNIPTVEEVQSPALPDGSQPTGTQVVNWDGSGTAGNLVSSDIAPSATSLPRVDTTSSISSFITIRVIGYSANAIDPDTGTSVGAGDYVQLIAYSTDPQMGVSPEYEDTQAIAVNSGVISGITLQSPGGPANLLDFSIANLTAADVGTSMSFMTNAAQSGLTGTQGNPLSVNSTGTEGGDVSIALPSVSTNALNLSGITVLPSNVENYLDQNSGSDSSNQFAADDAQLRVQAALDSISQVRATVGAQTVALQEDAKDAAVDVVNQTASESAIRDLDVGQAVTQFTKDQIMTQIGTSVMAQMQSNAQLVIQLVNGMNPGLGGKV